MRSVKQECLSRLILFGENSLRSAGRTQKGAEHDLEECLSRLILFGENSLRRALANFVEHYHSERNHQGKGDLLFFPAAPSRPPTHRPTIRCRERIGGLLKYYSRAA